jgi:hypothetical protein
MLLDNPLTVPVGHLELRAGRAAPSLADAENDSTDVVSLFFRKVLPQSSFARDAGVRHGASTAGTPLPHGSPADVILKAGA